MRTAMMGFMRQINGNATPLPQTSTDRLQQRLSRESLYQSRDSVGGRETARAQTQYVEAFVDAPASDLAWFTIS